MSDEYGPPDPRSGPADAPTDAPVTGDARLFRDVFTTSPIGMALLGDDGLMLMANPALQQMLARPADGLVGVPLSAFVHPDDVGRVDGPVDPDGGATRAEHRLIRADSSIVVAEITVTPATDGVRAILQVRDVTEERHAVDRLLRLAHHDPVTAVGNRSMAMSSLVAAMERVDGSQQRLVVLFVDINGFKRINEAYSHAVGDEVLHTVAQRIRAAVRTQDMVARWGGAEFIVMATDLPDDATALALAARVEEAVARPIAVRGDTTIYVSASTGVAFREPGDELSVEALLRHVDAATYRSKQEGRSRFYVFDESLRESSNRTSMIEDVIRRALDDDLLVVHYQPCVNVHDGEVVAFEALMRLRTDGGELLAPDQFLTLATDIGMLVQLEREALRRVCHQTMAWRHRGIDLLASVNVSVRQLDDIDGFEAYVRAVLDESGLPGDRLTLEITEHAFLDVSADTVRGMSRLVGQGVSFSVDDFGTGYGSMTYLRTLPIQEIKVDRSFVQFTPGERAASAIVRAHATLARELGVRCVAEGVETPQQHEFLLAIGIDLAQGYYYERPLPADSFYELVSDPEGAVGSRRSRSLR